MNEFIKQAAISLFTGFGGILAVYALFKFIIKKWIESVIDQQMQKSLADYQKNIDRQNSSYNLRIQKEFDYFDLVQVQRYNIVSNVMLFVSYMDEGNSKGVVATGSLLIGQFDDFIEKFKSNEGYLSKDIRDQLSDICICIVEFIQLIVSIKDIKDLKKCRYKEIGNSLIDKCEIFKNGLTDYIISKET